ncbi:unnamed protein product [Rhodiola kirilowii]
MAAPGSGDNNTMAYLAVIAIRFIYAVMYLLSKVVFDGGMNNNIFVFYRQTAATLFLLPFALFYGWKSAPPLLFKTFCKIFLLAFVGITLSLNFNGIGLANTSATITAASSNVVPVITFILAVMLRMELLKWRTKSGVAKSVGIIICMGGVAILAFYKGPGFTIIPYEKQLFHSNKDANESHHSTKTWLKGCFFLFVCNFSWASWIVFQGSVLKLYPSKLLFTSLQCALSMLQSFFVAIAFERDPQEWKLGLNLRLLVVVYCGVMVTGVSYYLQSYVIEKKGPVFFSLTTPLCLIITVTGSTVILGEVLTLGSIIGAILLVIGLYSVLWGKNRDPKLIASKIEIENISEDENEKSKHNEIENENDQVKSKKELPGVILVPVLPHSLV